MPSHQAVVNLSGNVPQQPGQPAGRLLVAAQPQPLKTTLPGGIAYEGDLQGNRTYSMGTPGQDGYGRMSVRSGTGAPANQLARQALASQPQQIGGLSITGPQDAVNRLAAPVSTVNRNTPEYQRWEAENKLKANPSYGGKSIEGNSDMPLAHPAPAAPVGGWQTRLAVYKEQMAAADAASRLAAQSASQNAQERGANYRADLQFKSQQNENDIARQRLMGEQGFNDARIKTEGINQQKGQMEIESLQAIKAASDEYMKSPTPENERKYRALVGKFEKEAQYGTVGRYDDQGMKIGEDLYNKQTGELMRQDDNDRLHQLPKNPKELMQGRIYQTSKGVGQWNGTHFDLRWYDRDVQQPRPPAAPVWPSTGQLMP